MTEILLDVARPTASIDEAEPFAVETVKVFALEQKQKHSPRRHEGHEVSNALI
jgi:hypothetical protein